MAGANTIFTGDKLLTAANAGDDKDAALFAQAGAAGDGGRRADAGRARKWRRRSDNFVVALAAADQPLIRRSIAAISAISVDMNQCAAADFRRADAELNRVWGKVRADDARGDQGSDRDQ